jgi:hypothetical protein
LLSWNFAMSFWTLSNMVNPFKSWKFNGTFDGEHGQLPVVAGWWLCRCFVGQILNFRIAFFVGHRVSLLAILFFFAKLKFCYEFLHSFKIYCWVKILL